MHLFGEKKARTEHQYVEGQLSAYLDGQLSSKERAVVDRHLKSCAHCRWNLDTLKQTVQLTRSLSTVPVPRVFTIPVPAQGARARQRVPRKRPWGLPALQGATVLVAILFFLAVASDFALIGRLPASPPEPVAMLERVPHATQVGERAADSQEEAAVAEVGPGAAEETVASSVAETAVSSVVQAAASAVAEATASFVAEATVVTESPAREPDTSPMPEPAAEEELQAAEEALVVEAESVEETLTASPEPGVGAMGGVPFPPTGEAEDAAERPAAEEAPRASAKVTAATDLPPVAPSPTVAPDSSPTLIPTLAPTLAATVAVGSEPEPPEPQVSEPDLAGPAGSGLEEPGEAAPTLVAEVQVPAPVAREQEVAEPLGSLRDSVKGWLDTAEIALGIAFLVFGITTIAVMYRHRRAP